MQYLNYDDHLSISRVCKKFENIIINYIWKWKYRQVEVIKKPWISMIANHQNTNMTTTVNQEATINRLGENWQFMRTEEFDEFLQLNTANIENLQFWCKFGFSEEHNYLGVELSKELPKLTSLSFYGVILANYELKIIAQNCPLLNALVLEDCVNARKQILVLGHDVNVQTIASMKRLKSFTLKNNCIYKADMHVYNYRHIRDILKKLLIEKLHLNVAIYSDEDGYNCKDYRVDNSAEKDEMFVQNEVCQELEIGQFLRNEDLQDFSTCFLNKYPKLLKLSIGGYMFSSVISVDQEFYKLISKKLTKLEVLKISGCMLKDFVALPNLQQLVLEACKGLNWTHLTTMLNEMQLRSFTSHRTKYFGLPTILQFSPTLESLDLDVEGNEFLQIFKQRLPKVKSLLWQNDFQQNVQNINKCLPNIEILQISDNCCDLEELLQLNSLHTLTFHKCSRICDFLKLLTHPTLKYLTVENYVDEIQDIAKISSKHTNVSHVKVPLNLFKILQDFWLDLLSSNRHLILTVTLNYDRPVDEEFVLQLVNSKKFPTTIKAIQICGLNIDCADLKNYFGTMMKKIEVVSTILLPSPKQLTMVLCER
uniref:F-box domain-containing protein n=1 Tax=Stomoxys calcitrans TaxID=35570 RepID=A0A1I8P3M3_STOCA